MKQLAFVLLFATACGNAEIVAPSPLFVVDSYPGQGALIGAGDIAIALTFSEAIDATTTEDGVRLSQTTPTGTLIREIAMDVDSYTAETFTVTFDVDPLPADATFQLTAFAETVAASSGAVLPSDVVRRFRTAAP